MKIAWLLVPLAFQLPQQCAPRDQSGKAEQNVVTRCTEERQKCRTPTGGVGECIKGDASQCENPPCLICNY